MDDKKTSVELEKDLNGVIKIDSAQIHSRIDSMVRSTVEEMLNKMLDEEADALCNAARYEHSEARTDKGEGREETTILRAYEKMCEKFLALPAKIIEK